MKVSNWLAIAIKSALERNKGDKELLIIRHAHAKKIKRNNYWEDERKILNDLSVMELAEILVLDYEVEETPQEHLARLFNNEWSVAKKEAVIRALDILNIKVSGVNN